MATYTINESTARLSHEMRSWSDYHAGSATREYEAQVAQAAAILEQVKAKCFTEEQKERAEYLFDRYAKTLAEATNKENEIGTRCPSVMICGAGNFPVRKKQKQIKAFEANRENWRKAEHYLDQLKRAHTLSVKDSDPEVLDFLRAKLAGLEAGHELMISANAYYRKHKTLDGFDGIPEKTLAWITKPGVYMAGGRNGDGSPLAFHGKPFPTYELTSSKATIKRVQTRIAKIEAAKAAAPVEDERDGYTYKEDQEIMRVQLIFPGKPDDETRDVLKHNGFHWSPRNGAWQRQLNDAGKYAAHRVMEFLDGNE